MGYDESVDIFSGPSYKRTILVIISKHSRALLKIKLHTCNMECFFRVANFQ